MDFWKGLILPLVTIILKLSAWINKYMLGNNIPHPSERLINWLFSNNLLHTLEYLTDVLFTYGIFRFQGKLYLLDPKLCLKVMHKVDKGASDYLPTSPIKDSFLSDSERSPDIRHMIAASFRKSMMEQKGILMTKVIEKVVSKMADMEVVNINELTLAASLDVVGLVLFGTDLGAMDGKQGRFLQAMETMVNGLTSDLITPGTQEFLDNRKSLADETESIFHHCLDQNPDSDNLLHLLSKAGSLEQAKVNLQMFLMVGSETTSATLSVLMHFLAKTPELQKDLQEEADEWIGPLQTDASLVPPKLESSLKEVLRVYSTALYSMRQTFEELDLGDIRIPAKSNLRIFIWGIHRCPHLWKDAKNFCPGRFMTSSHSGQSYNSFFPFGAGPRVCPGQHLSWVEMRLMMTYLLHHFTFRPVLQTEDLAFCVDWEHSVAHAVTKVILGVEKRCNN